MTDTAPTTPQLTRDQLRTQINRIEATKRAVKENMAPLEAGLAAYQRQLDSMNDMLRKLAEPHPYNLGFCHQCGTPILTGERGFRYEDGIYFCVDHAPTFGEHLETLRTYPPDEWDEEGWGPLADMIAEYEAGVAKHGADTRYVFTL